MLKDKCVVYPEEILEAVDRGEDIFLTEFSIQEGALSELMLTETIVNSVIRLVCCSFQIPVKFSGTKFLKDVSFKGTRFTKDADFSKCEFLKSQPEIDGVEFQNRETRKKALRQLLGRKLRKVWIVHGRNEQLRDRIFNFIRSIGLEPIEFGEAIALTRKAAPYIGEVLDAAFDNAQAVVVLLTGDDEARLRSEYLRSNDPDYERNLAYQPRPNVIFEAGMALAKERERTILVQSGFIRPISDMQGIHVVRLDDTLSSLSELARRLENADCDVDVKWD